MGPEGDELETILKEGANCLESVDNNLLQPSNAVRASATEAKLSISFHRIPIRDDFAVFGSPPWVRSIRLFINRELESPIWRIIWLKFLMRLHTHGRNLKLEEGIRCGGLAEENPVLVTV